jgi:hypothetical protein
VWQRSITAPFEGWSRSTTSTKGTALRSSGYYLCAIAGFRFDSPALKCLSSLEAGNPGHAQVPSPMTNAKFGKVFHTRLHPIFVFEKVTADRVSSGKTLFPEKFSICEHYLPIY